MDIVTNVFIEKNQQPLIPSGLFTTIKGCCEAIIEKTLLIHGPQTSFTIALKTVWAVTDTPAENDFTAIIRSSIFSRFSDQ